MPNRRRKISLISLIVACCLLDINFGYKLSTSSALKNFAHDGQKPMESGQFPTKLPKDVPDGITTDAQVENILDELAFHLKVPNSTKFPVNPTATNRQSSTVDHSLTTVKTTSSNKNNGNFTEPTNQNKIDCDGFGPMEGNEFENNVTNFCYSPTDSLTCYQDPIFCKVYHMSGKRELEWPVYGEYSYLSHSNWVKILQHGGIVFLYHPCSNESLVAQLRTLAESCLYKFVLTPYKKLTWQRPLALVSWGCYLLMKDVNLPESENWIKSHAYKAPASHVHKNGSYETKLVKPSRVLTDIKDSFLCPNETEKAIFHVTPAPKRNLVIVVNKHPEEALLLKRLAKVKHIRITHKSAATHLAVNTKNAFSAFCSLVFLCVLLSLLMLYTKLWRPGQQGSKCFNKQFVDFDDGFSEGSSRNNGLGLLKSSQNFINSFRRKKKERKIDSPSSVRLLSTISEEDDEFEEIY